MVAHLSLVLKNTLSELPRMSDAVSAWCKENGIVDEPEFHVHLALDEIVTNVILHGWKDQGNHELQVRLTRSENVVTLEVEDDAPPFNPLEVPAPDISQPLEKRIAGGLGIFIVRQIMDSVDYHRIEGKNLLIMKKKISSV